MTGSGLLCFFLALTDFKSSLDSGFCVVKEMVALLYLYLVIYGALFNCFMGLRSLLSFPCSGFWSNSH